MSARARVSRVAPGLWVWTITRPEGLTLVGGVRTTQQRALDAAYREVDLIRWDEWRRAHIIDEPDEVCS